MSEYGVGVDVGGTHTDLILVGPDQVVRRKAFTTHGDYSVGIFDALSLAAEDLGTTVRELLPRVGTFVNGSTIVTNAVTELRGAPVGVLVTRGFKDTFRLAGGARRDVYDDHAQVPPQDVVARDCIEEVTERVLGDGTRAVPLDDDEVRAAVRRLRERGVEAVAVCYLWSFLDGSHERRTKEILAEEFPEAFVTLSSEVHPVIREYPRFMTAVFNCLAHRATSRYVDGLADTLAEHGFTGALSFFQGIGGSVGADAVRAEPISLMQSGPAGGVMAARHVAARMGLRDILVGDMGGTSFDTAVLPALEPAIAKEAIFGPFRTGVDILDIVSVGAGGGSIAWVDARGVPRIGPESAGSEPGPACYGRGGLRPTVTDANLVLGLIDPDNYLGGRHRLDRAAARDVIASEIGKPLGRDAEQAAAAVYDLAAAEMANALRSVSVERGHDPRDFAFLSYGGGLGLFAVEICRRLGCSRIVVPDNSPAFSAYGVLIADYVRQYDRTVTWDLSLDDSERVNAVVGDLVRQARKDAEAEGLAADDLEIRRSGDFRFLGQVYEVAVPLPDRDFTPEDGPRLAAEFPGVYESHYGEGTAWVGTPVVLLTVSITATHRRPKPDPRRLPGRSGDAVAAERRVFLPIEREFAMVPVHHESAIGLARTIAGPAIVDVGDTTLYVPAGVTCTRDDQANFLLSTGEA